MKKKSTMGSVSVLLLFIMTFFLTGIVYAETYTETRAEDNLQFSGSWGLHIPTLQAPTGTIAYGISGKTFFGLEYGANDSSEIKYVIEATAPDCVWLFFGCSGGHSRKAKMKGEFVNQGAFIRYYPLDNFYFFVAYHQRTYDAELVGTEDGSEEIEAEINLKANVGTIGIGNQWNFSSGIFIATSWVTASYLIDSSIDYTITRTAGLSTAEIEEWEDDIEETGKHVNQLNSTVGFAILSIGFAF